MAKMIEEVFVIKVAKLVTDDSKETTVLSDVAFDAINEVLTMSSGSDKILIEIFKQ